uniref:DUF4283 domain-containing protein n=1 Tax=Tanacetum cinerariifolium TaxID=118510 RepID=A0A6L2M5B1_TANCI|nr:hypothetical protein [Tanacetum cinerariifolium]
MNTSSCTSLSMKLDDTMNDDTNVVVATAATEKLSSLEDTTVLGSFPPLPTQVTTSAGNAPGRSSYVNITSKTSGKKVNVRTFFTTGGNGIDVVVTVDSIRAISERFANIAYGWFLGKKVAYPVVANYFRNSWDAMFENGPWFIRNNSFILKKWHPDENLLKKDVSTVPIWVKLHGLPVTAFSEDGLSAIATKLADVELKDNIGVAMPKITKEGHYTCNVRVEYEWKPPMCSSCGVFGHIHEECLTNTSVGEKKPSQTSRGVPVGTKMGFKPQKEYRPVPKKTTASSSGNKKKGVEPTIEVSNLNTFDVLNSVDNDVEFGTNGETTNLVNNGVTSSGSSFMYIDNDGEFVNNTPIGKKIDKIERQICEVKIRLLNNDGNPLVSTGIVESGSEVDSYLDNNDYDPYNDDMYENHDLSEHLQSICDDLDITICGKKKN